MFESCTCITYLYIYIRCVGVCFCGSTCTPQSDPQIHKNDHTKKEEEEEEYNQPYVTAAAAIETLILA